MKIKIKFCVLIICLLTNFIMLSQENHHEDESDDDDCGEVETPGLPIDNGLYFLIPAAITIYLYWNYKKK